VVREEVPKELSSETTALIASTWETTSFLGLNPNALSEPQASGPQVPPGLPTKETVEKPAFARLMENVHPAVPSGMKSRGMRRT
jgi:hypothetical protein